MATRLTERRNPACIRKQGGIILIEVLVAVLIFSIGILGIIGMQAASVTAVSDAKYRSEAAMVADQIIARMWVGDPTTEVATAAALAGYEAKLPAGKKTVTYSAATRKATVTITWHPPELPASAPDRQFATETMISL